MVEYASMKSLNGSELAGFIKERQAKQVRALKQAQGVQPRLVIVRTNPNPVVDKYMELKTSYGEDIGVEVDVLTIGQDEAEDNIKKINQDDSVHGVIVQIPLPDPKQTDEILNMVAPEKDVDGLADSTTFDAPTPLAVNWLLAGYNIEPKKKNVVIVGHGRLVGRPLVKLWKASGIEAKVVDKSVQDLAAELKEADIIVSATGVPGLIKKEMLKDNVVIVDAGVSTDNNGLVGDVAKEVREIPDITITPEKGGVGPLTVCALFENVLIAARKSSE